MSEHLEMSEDSSLDRNFQIRTNNQGENELYIPCWEEEGSSSTQYHHLIEETKFFKNKCKHLENHLEENHREFSSLNQLYMIAESNQRRLLKENEELKKRIKDLLNELSEVNTAHELAQSETQAMSKRENQLRERLFRSKERQTELANQLDLLESELEATKLKPTVSPRNSDQEEKWKKHYTDIIAHTEERWKTAYEELESQFDRKTKEVKEKYEEIKAIQKSINSIREDHEQKVKGLNIQIQDLKRQVTRAKTVSTDHERNVRDLKAVLEEVSIKNDEIQRQNNKLRSKLKEESNRYIKLQKESRQQLQLSEEGKKLLEQQQNQNNSLRNMLNEFKAKCDKIEKEAGQLKLDKDRILVTKNHLENVNAALRDQISQLNLRIQQENNNITRITEEKIKQVKQRSNDEISTLSLNLTEKDRQIAALQRQITTLQRQSTQDPISANAKEQINQLRTEIASWKSKFERVDNIRRQLERQTSTVVDCGHSGELRSLRDQVQSFESSRQEFRQANFKQQRLISDLKSQLTDTYTKSTLQTQEKDRLFRENQRLQQEKEHLNTQISRLKEDRHALSDRQKNREKLKSGSQQQLNSKILIIEQLRSKLVQTEREMEIIRSSTRVREEGPDKDKEKLKRLEAKLQEKDGLLQQQQIRIQELQSRTEDAQAARKSSQKELRSKQNELSKRDRKIKQLERELNNTHLLEREIEQLKEQMEAIRKQLKSEQTQHEKLKFQVAKNQDKENTRQGSNNDWNAEKMKLQVEWEDKYKKMANMLKIKQQEIVILKREFEQTKKLSVQQSTMAEQKRISGELEQSLRQRIRELEDQVQKLQQSLRNARDEDPNASLQQLEAEYQRQLLALKRLIVFKGYKEDQSKRSEEIRAEYEAKIQYLLNDYKAMQQDLIILREKLLNQRPEPSIDVAAIEQAWRIRIEQLADEREVLIQRVAMWQRKYEELRYLFETKLQAKEEAINLLNLKLSNLQMSRTSLPPPCPYPCHHR